MTDKPTNADEFPGAALSLLCIGLDVAWFGGSAGNPDSQYDCVAAAHLSSGSAETPRMHCEFSRISLIDRDPQAAQLLQALTDLLQQHRTATRIILAVDAPLQVIPRPHLAARSAIPATGTVERRACENHFSRQRQRIDQNAGGSRGWHPNLQPGAPLAPRVMHLLAGLQQHGFSVWTPDHHQDSRLVCECFPAEAIWAMKRLDRYAAHLTATQVKAYKKQQGKSLAAEDITHLVHTALDAFATDTGIPSKWYALVQRALDWLQADPTWQTFDGYYRGGKLLDDVVDSLLCLATALSYAHGQAHVWQDEQQPDDGHIIGPGLLPKNT